LATQYGLTPCFEAGFSLLCSSSKSSSLDESTANAPIGLSRDLGVIRSGIGQDKDVISLTPQFIEVAEGETELGYLFQQFAERL